MIPFGGALLSGRYALDKLLGSGGAASVYSAQDTLLGAPRAIKLLSDAASYGEGMRKRLRNEAQAMAQIDHPNVLRVFDMGEHEGQDFIVMELAEGGSLAQWLEQEGPLPAAAAVHYGLQVLSALDAAHQAGVVHRDVKPQNILLSRFGVALLADFGIAMFSEDAMRTTRTNMAMGSMCFMAPEQRMDAKSVGPSADVYAMACTLFNLLCDGNPIDLFTARLGAQRWEDIPEPLREVLWRASRHDPEERYPDAASMAADLARALEDLDEGALPSLGHGGLPLPSPQATATAISRITNRRVRAVSVSTLSTLAATPQNDASATFFPEDLTPQPDALSGGGAGHARADSGDLAAFSPPRTPTVAAQASGTLVPLEEALAQLSAAIPHTPTLHTPAPDDGTLLPPPAAVVDLEAPADGPARRRWLAPMLIALALLIGLAWWMWPTDPSPDGVPELAVAEGPAAELLTAEAPPELADRSDAPPPAEEEEAPPAASSEIAPSGAPSPEAPPAAVSAPSAGRPAAKDPPLSGAAEGSAEPDDRPQSVVAGEWTIMMTGDARILTLKLSGPDEDLRGRLLYPTGSPAPEPMKGSYDPASGVLVVRRANGQPYLELTRVGSGSAQTGKVTTPTGMVTATLFQTPLTSP